eukprot:803471-Amphidinium_carterae.1
MARCCARRQLSTFEAHMELCGIGKIARGALLLGEVLLRCTGQVALRTAADFGLPPKLPRRGEDPLLGPALRSVRENDVRSP